jgi:hypothetical protein
LHLIGLVFVAVGLFAIAGAALQWSWFLGHRKAQAMTKLLGRTGTRVFYCVLGLALIVFGVLMAAKVIPISS